MNALRMQQLAYLLESKVRFSSGNEICDLRARRRLFGLCLQLFANTEFCKDLKHMPAARTRGHDDGARRQECGLQSIHAGYVYPRS